MEWGGMQQTYANQTERIQTYGDKKFDAGTIKASSSLWRVTSRTSAHDLKQRCCTENKCHVLVKRFIWQQKIKLGSVP